MNPIHASSVLLTCAVVTCCGQLDSTATTAAPPKAPISYAKCEEGGREGTRVCDPSLTELVVRPELYDGAVVVVVGVLDLDRESFALFASKKAYQQFLTREAVRLSLRPGADLRLQNLRAEWVCVRGKYLAREQSGSVRYGGVITDVTDVSSFGSARTPALPAPRMRMP
jgi:hypothetical protein